MERKYYLNGQEIPFDELLEYVGYLLSTSGDTSRFADLGIDFEDVEVE